MSRDLRLSSLPLSRAYVVIALATAITVGCSNETHFARSGVMKAKVNGITPTTKSIAKGETITHYDDAKARVAQAFIPNGALAIEQKVTMASSYHTDPADLKDEFAIKKGGVIKETQVATVIQSNMDKNLKQPMVIALDLPPAASSLWNLIWNDRNFFVVYTIRDSERDEWRRGIMDEDDMEIRDDLVVFSSPYMGRYEIFESVDPIEYEAPAKPVAKPDFNNPPVAITSVKPLVQHPGKPVVIEGKYLSKKSKVYLAGRLVEGVTFVSKQQVKFTLPEQSFGKKELKVTEGSNMAYGNIIVHNKNQNIPYADRMAAKHLCTNQPYYDLDGTKRAGTRECGTEKCENDQQTGCMATAQFPALDPNDLEKQKGYMFKTLTVHSVSGDMDVPGRTRLCTDSVNKECNIKGGYIAYLPGSIKENILKKDEELPGELNKVIKGKYPSDQYTMPGAAEASSQVLMLVGGKQGAKNMATAASGTVFEFWDRKGQRHTFKNDGSLIPENIAEGAEIYGIKGKSVGGSYPCKKSGQGDCKLTVDYVSELATKVVPGNFKSGVQVGNVTGEFPSATSPLKAGPANGTALTKNNYEETIRSTGSYVFYNRKGEPLTGQGESNLQSANLRTSVSVFGVSGTLAESSGTKLNAENIRAGVTIAGVAGELKANCRSMALPTAQFDAKKAPGGAGLDIYDTVTEVHYPTTNPWDAKDQYSCGKENWVDLTPGGPCTGPRNECLFKDKVTGFQWSGLSVEPGNYESADAACKALRSNSGWRLPTVEELYQAYAHGIYALAKNYNQMIAKNWVSQRMWSSSPAKSGAGVGLTMNLALGTVVPAAKTDTTNVVYFCVKK